MAAASRTASSCWPWSAWTAAITARHSSTVIWPNGSAGDDDRLLRQLPGQLVLSAGPGDHRPHGRQGQGGAGRVGRRDELVQSAPGRLLLVGEELGPGQVAGPHPAHADRREEGELLAEGADGLGPVTARVRGEAAGAGREIQLAGTQLPGDRIQLPAGRDRGVIVAAQREALHQPDQAEEQKEDITRLPQQRQGLGQRRNRIPGGGPASPGAEEPERDAFHVPGAALPGHLDAPAQRLAPGRAVGRDHGGGTPPHGQRVRQRPLVADPLGSAMASSR